MTASFVVIRGIPILLDQARNHNFELERSAAGPSCFKIMESENGFDLYAKSLGHLLQALPAQ